MTTDPERVREIKAMLEAHPVRRECNRHADCDKAAQEWASRYWEKHGGSYSDAIHRIPVDFHCHDDECEECFGN